MLSHYNTIVDPFNAFKLDPERFYYLAFFWDALDVEEHHESLTYDLSAFLAAAGGNLGLALGYSCLSALVCLIEIVFRKLNPY